ncbi:hypothetical protein MVEN_02443800 [Mycena venus]|uniref:Chromodomain-helicase-DNA-binding protein 1-like C-terminal domain-containing protein n=1 Tax=Mycena venus TaxID=2733690 RepID=A0A8H6WYI2_9AGAR|nr:hypothetical protein MVEN_02443800 [Mycena venus]
MSHSQGFGTAKPQSQPTSIARSFTLSVDAGASRDIEYTEHRGYGAPPPTLGVLGDIYIDVKRPALFARCGAGRWTEWGPGSPLQHPSYPEQFLWASTRRSRVLWLAKAKMAKLIGTAADVLRQIIASEDPVEAGGAKKPRPSEPVPTGSPLGVESRGESSAPLASPPVSRTPSSQSAKAPSEQNPTPANLATAKPTSTSGPLEADKPAVNPSSVNTVTTPPLLSSRGSVTKPIAPTTSPSLKRPAPAPMDDSSRKRPCLPSSSSAAAPSEIPLGGGAKPSPVASRVPPAAPTQKPSPAPPLACLESTKAPSNNESPNPPPADHAAAPSSVKAPKPTVKPRPAWKGAAQPANPLNGSPVKVIPPPILKPAPAPANSVNKPHSPANDTTPPPPCEAIAPQATTSSSARQAADDKGRRKRQSVSPSPSAAKKEMQPVEKELNQLKARGLSSDEKKQHLLIIGRHIDKVLKEKEDDQWRLLLWTYAKGFWPKKADAAKLEGGYKRLVADAADAPKASSGASTPVAGGSRMGTPAQSTPALAINTPPQPAAGRGSGTAPAAPAPKSPSMALPEVPDAGTVSVPPVAVPEYRTPSTPPPVAKPALRRDAGTAISDIVGCCKASARTRCGEGASSSRETCPRARISDAGGSPKPTPIGVGAASATPPAKPADQADSRSALTPLPHAPKPAPGRDPRTVSAPPRTLVDDLRTASDLASGSASTPKPTVVPESRTTSAPAPAAKRTTLVQELRTASEVATSGSTSASKSAVVLESRIASTLPASKSSPVPGTGMASAPSPALKPAVVPDSRTPSAPPKPALVPNTASSSTPVAKSVTVPRSVTVSAPSPETPARARDGMVSPSVSAPKRLAKDSETVSTPTSAAKPGLGELLTLMRSNTKILKSTPTPSPASSSALNRSTVQAARSSTLSSASAQARSVVPKIATAPAGQADLFALRRQYDRYHFEALTDRQEHPRWLAETAASAALINALTRENDAIKAENVRLRDLVKRLDPDSEELPEHLPPTANKPVVRDDDDDVFVVPSSQSEPLLPMDGAEDSRLSQDRPEEGQVALGHLVDPRQEEEEEEEQLMVQEGSDLDDGLQTEEQAEQTERREEPEQHAAEEVMAVDGEDWNAPWPETIQIKVESTDVPVVVPINIERPDIIDLTLDDSDDEDAGTSEGAARHILEGAYDKDGDDAPMDIGPSFEPSTDSLPQTSSSTPINVDGDPDRVSSAALESPLIEPSAPGHFSITGTDFDFTDETLQEIVDQNREENDVTKKWGTILASLMILVRSSNARDEVRIEQWAEIIEALRDYYTRYAVLSLGRSDDRRPKSARQEQPILPADHSMEASEDFRMDIAAQCPVLADPTECRDTLQLIKIKAEIGDFDGLAVTPPCARRLNQSHLDVIFPTLGNEPTIQCVACLEEEKYECLAETPLEEMSAHVEKQHPRLFERILAATEGMSHEEIVQWFDRLG